MEQFFLSLLLKLFTPILFFVKKGMKLVKRLYLKISNRFFYDEQSLNNMIYNYNWDFTNNRFIHYELVFKKKIYKEERKKVRVTRNGGVSNKIIELPYKECINFIENPNVRIEIENYQSILATYFPPLKQDKAVYLKAKPKTTNESILCMRDLVKEENFYKVKLSAGNFLDIACTNLMLDYPLEKDLSSRKLGLRMYDIRNTKGKLPEFKESILMNFIGVSGIWCMETQRLETNFKFFLKSRRGKMSIYSKMLGTTSGYVHVPDKKRFSDKNLMNYLREEMRREFYEETGYREYMKSKKLQEEEAIKIIPLAFTRELLRGGAPQFFFIIITPYVSDKDLAKCFKKTDGDLNEFKDSILARAMGYPLSPETLTNLLYCYQYLQKDCFQKEACDNMIYL